MFILRADGAVPSVAAVEGPTLCGGASWRPRPASCGPGAAQHCWLPPRPGQLYYQYLG